MKKHISILLALCLVVGLAACAGGEGAKETTAEAGPAFQAGYGEVDITPEGSVNMAGHGDHNTRFSSGYILPIKARAVALQDENGEKLLLIVAETSFAYPVVATEVLKDIEAKLGIPQDHIVISGVHTHDSVACFAATSPDTTKFNEKYIAGCLKAAEMALEDCKPVEAYVGGIETENMTFVRRYYTDLGEQAGDGIYNVKGTIVGHETEADNDLQLLKFVREGGQDIVIAHFQGHPQLEGKISQLSPDIPGFFCAEIEQKLDVHCMYWNGAAGNLKHESRIKEENRASSCKDWAKIMGKYVEDAYNDLPKVETGDIKVASTTYVGASNKSENHLLSQAQEVMNKFNNGTSIDDCNKLAWELGLNSFYHARNIVSHAKLSDTYEMTITAFSFGDVAGIVVPYEMFDTNGMQIKEQSPFVKTFIAGYSYPSYEGYIPAIEVWENGGYEVESSKFAPGAAEELVTEYLGLLNGMIK